MNFGHIQSIWATLAARAFHGRPKLRVFSGAPSDKLDRDKKSVRVMVRWTTCLRSPDRVKSWLRLTLAPVEYSPRYHTQPPAPKNTYTAFHVALQSELNYFVDSKTYPSRSPSWMMGKSMPIQMTQFVCAKQRSDAHRVAQAAVHVN